MLPMGVRASVFEQLRETLGPDFPASTNRRLRNETTLAVVRPLIAFGNSLPDYTRNTEDISETAQRVCAAVTEAREPDELLFAALPEACGMSPFGRGSRQDETAAGKYIERLRGALAELRSAYPQLLETIGSLIHVGFGSVGPRRALRESFRSRSRPLLAQVIEPKMRSFLATACNEQLEDDEWLEAMAQGLTAKAPKSWMDHDVTLFEALTAERAHWFRRLELLYHEMNASPGPGFDARRVTLTAPDGGETAELVRVDQATQELVGDVLDRALGELEGRLGDQASRTLLGVLATKLLPAEQPSARDVVDEEDKVRRA